LTRRTLTAAVVGADGTEAIGSMNRVPFVVEQTGDEKVDRNLYAVSKAVRDLQTQIAPPQTLTSAVDVLLGNYSTVIVSRSAIRSITVWLPTAVPSNQTTTIRNESPFAVHVRTSDSRTVLPDIAAGGSLTVNANGTAWGAT